MKPRQIMLRTFFVIVLAASAMEVKANSVDRASRESVAASIGLPIALSAASVTFFRDAGELSVASVRAVESGVVIVLKGAASGAEFSVHVGGKALEGSAMVAGSTLHAISTATGYLLVAAGKAVLFIPNEIGQSLLHHSRARDRSREY